MSEIVYEIISATTSKQSDVGMLEVCRIVSQFSRACGSSVDDVLNLLEIALDINKSYRNIPRILELANRLSNERGCSLIEALDTTVNLISAAKKSMTDYSTH